MSRWVDMFVSITKYKMIMNIQKRLNIVAHLAFQSLYVLLDKSIVSMNKYVSEKSFSKIILMLYG